MKNKFTLTELLFVIAIIGILVSILFPSLSRARQKAVHAVCISNNRQLYIAMNSYIENNQSYFPVASFKDDNPPGYGRRDLSFDDLLSGYDGRNLTEADMQLRYLPKSPSPSIYKCPASKKTNPDYEIRTYSMNAGWMGTTANINLYGWGIARYDNAKKLTLIDDTSTFITVENSKDNNLMGYGGNGHTFGNGFRTSSDVNFFIHDESIPNLTSVLVNGSARGFRIMSEGVSPENFWTSNFD